MTDEELFNLLCEKLYVDETKLGGEYRHKKSAEYLERAMYWCPTCGLSRFESHGEQIACQRCGMTLRYMPDLTLSPVSGEFPYRTVADWYEAQDRFVLGLDLSPYADTPVYTDTVDLIEVIPYKEKRPVAGGIALSVYADRYELCGDGFSLTLPFDELIAVTVLGRNKLNLYRGEEIFQIKGDKRFNALKHMHIFYRARQKKEDNENAGFLGI
jgi:ribosomal protein S27AE